MRKSSRHYPLLQLIAFVAVILLSAVQLGSQSGNPTVAIASIPSWGQDGSMTGYVYGTSTSQVSLYAFEFIPDVGWYSVSGCGPIQIQSTGSFTVSVTGGIMGRYATRFSAYLVPSSLSVPCAQATATIPFIYQQNALSVATIPRIPQYSTLNFGGLTWFIKTAPVQVSPPNQFFVQQNAFVDSLGQLHLQLNQCGGAWCAAEIFTTQTLGYGTYTFTINSPVNNLDPNVTLGLFPWDAQAGDHYNREWDIEFGRWGNAGASANAQYVVQPYNGPNNIVKFLMSPASPSTHTVIWQPNDVQFASTSGSGLIDQWTFPGNPLPVPTPGDVHLHMNLYIAVGQAPTVPIGHEIVISNFQYVPYGGQIGFSTTANTTSFLASLYTVPVNSTSAGCTATVESDSPWITVLGPNPVPAGGVLQYSVPDNVGVTRAGNLILQSTNCNATLGSQVLSVTQPGFVCSPTFETDSDHIGFLQTVRSVFIRGTASECSWTVTSASPWLTITSSASGSGDGSFQFTAAGQLGRHVAAGIAFARRWATALGLPRRGGCITWIVTASRVALRESSSAIRAVLVRSEQRRDSPCISWRAIRRGIRPVWHDPAPPDRERDLHLFDRGRRVAGPGERRSLSPSSKLCRAAGFAAGYCKFREPFPNVDRSRVLRDHIRHEPERFYFSGQRRSVPANSRRCHGLAVRNAMPASLCIAHASEFRRPLRPASWEVSPHSQFRNGRCHRHKHVARDLHLEWSGHRSPRGIAHRGAEQWL